MQPRRYLKKLPLQANFYPMPVMAYIQDAQSRLTLHTAQALGVSSLHDGEWGTEAVQRVKDKKGKPTPRPSLSTPQVSPSFHAWRRGEPLIAPVSHTQALEEDTCLLSPLP